MNVRCRREHAAHKTTTIRQVCTNVRYRLCCAKDKAYVTFSRSVDEKFVHLVSFYPVFKGTEYPNFKELCTVLHEELVQGTCTPDEALQRRTALLAGAQ